MQRTIYALLVGIDKYPTPVNPLHGCVNDVQHVETLLSERIVGEGDRFEPLVLTNGKATRQAIINAFRNHLGKAGSNDVALFYYSGHGSQAPSPREFWHLEPDKLDETVVCFDSRTPGGWDLADKELAQLISEVAANDPHIAIILDCCHSGSGTRAPEDAGVRRVPSDDRQRPIDTFIVTPAQATSLDQAAREQSTQTASGWFTLPQGRHVVLSACRAEEEAKELFLGGETRGAFSYYLLDTLQRTGESLTYRDLFKRVNALVRAKVSRQSPLMEATDLRDLNQPFLGGAIVAGSPYFTLSYDKDRDWMIDGGAVHGIPPVAGDETTLLALFPFDAPLEGLRDLSAAIGEARVQETLPAQSKVEVTLFDGSTPDLDLTYKVVVTALPLPPLIVSMEGENAALKLVRAALATTGPNGKPSLLVCEGDRKEAELRLLADENRYRIRRSGDAYALVVDTQGFNKASAELVVHRLEHIARWTRIAELSNKTSRIPSNAVRMEIVREDEAAEPEVIEASSDLRLDYEYKDGEWQQPQFKLKLTNTTSNQRLYCMLLDLTETYMVYPGLLPGGGIWLDPGQEAWALGGQPIYALVPDELWQQGLVEIKDTIKLIVSTDESDAALLGQDELAVSLSRGVPKAAPVISHMSTLNRLMHRVHTRNFSAKPAKAEALADWTASEISVTTVRPLEAAAVPQPGQTTTLGSGVTLLGHPSLEAKARLSTVSQAGRDAGNLAVPSLLRDHPDVVQPFEFSRSRGGEPGLSVLELVDVDDHTVVTAEDPLVVKVAASLGDDEHLLPVGFDGEFFLPLGRAIRADRGTEIKLERLPAPTSGGARDLKGSIRIMFQKIIGQRIGLEFPYPVLAAASVADDGSVTYTPATTSVREKVANANRILLYAHGMFGDTRGMAGSARVPGFDKETVPALADRYDLILTFDYESINTTIEDTARALKGRLEAVGLSPNHGKTLHLVAHSLGGAVARWMVEREGGNQMVQHLITLGSPHAGSPWPTVQAWATTALTIGLNSLSTVTWPVKALASLVSAIELVDVTLDQIRPGSDFLKSLNSSPDPGVAYTVLAGNTSIIEAATEPEPGEEQSRLARLVAKLNLPKLAHDVTALAFLGQPNDIAVSVESAQGVALNRSPQPKFEEVACDHVTYFSSEAGLRALAESLG